jgi:TolB-like protein
MHVLPFIGLLAGVAPAAAAVEPPRPAVAVMEFTSKGGVTADQMEALADLVQTEIRKLGRFEVMGKSDIRALLKYEEQKALLANCGEDSCYAELGGALGARWVVVGNVSRFGGTYLLNLKLLDSQRSRLANSISRSIKGGEEALLSEMPAAVGELIADLLPQGKGAPPPDGSSRPPAGPRWELSLQGLFFGGMAAGKEVALAEGGAFLASGDMTGQRLGMGVRGAYLIGSRQAVFVQVDFLMEHWVGTAWNESGTADEWEIGVDFPVVRGRAGYRIAWPVLPWFAPYAEAGVGIQATLSRRVSLRDAAGGVAADLEVEPENALRFAATLGLGLEARFSAFAIGAGYLWDVPIYKKSTNSVVAHVATRF